MSGFGVAAAWDSCAGGRPRCRDPGIEQPTGVQLLLDRVGKGCVRLPGRGILVLVGRVMEGSHAGSTPRVIAVAEQGTAPASLPESGVCPATAGEVTHGLVGGPVREAQRVTSRPCNVDHLD
jgi:hypothetical protein